VLNDRLANDVRRNGTRSNGTDGDHILLTYQYKKLSIMHARGGSRIWQGQVSNPSERGTSPKSALKVRAAGG